MALDEIICRRPVRSEYACTGGTRKLVNRQSVVSANIIAILFTYLSETSAPGDMILFAKRASSLWFY